MFFNGSRNLALSATRNQSTKTVTLIPGDGIGPEIAASVQRYGFFNECLILSYQKFNFKIGYLRLLRPPSLGNPWMLLLSGTPMVPWESLEM